MHEMKYVMINEDTPILFFDVQNHDAYRKMGNITSAGYVKITPNPKGEGVIAKVYGKSVGLKLYPAKFDEDMINDLLNK